MTYQEWFEAHAAKHAVIVNRLTHLSNLELVEYFRFENMVVNEPDFCLLYTENKKCHEVEHLNCYWCACPYFRFNDSGLSQQKDKILYSMCAIESKDGTQFVSDVSIHQDCTHCLIPHKEKVIKKEFNRNWRITMEEAPCK
jgi:Zn-finger protein